MPEPTTDRACCAACAARAQVATLTRERDAARAEADRLAGALRDVLAQFSSGDARGEVHAPGVTVQDVAVWRELLPPLPTAAVDALGPEITARRAIAAQLDQLAASDRLTAVWLERHGMAGQLAPPPPAILAALALDIAGGEVHGRRERWVIDGLVGSWVCAEPMPDLPDGICGMPVEDVPCTVHHPDAPEPTCPGDPHCRFGHRCDYHRGAGAPQWELDVMQGGAQP